MSILNRIRSWFTSNPYLLEMFTLLNVLFPDSHFDTVITDLADGSLSKPGRKTAALSITKKIWDEVGSKFIPWPLVVPWVSGRLEARLEMLKIKGVVESRTERNDGFMTALPTEGDAVPDGPHSA